MHARTCSYILIALRRYFSILLANILLKPLDFLVLLLHEMQFHPSLLALFDQYPCSQVTTYNNDSIHECMRAQ